MHEFTHLAVPWQHDGRAGVGNMLYWPLGAELGADGDEVLCRMAKESSRSMARAAAALLFEHSALPVLVPVDQQEVVRQDIAAAIDWGFQDLLSLSGSAYVTSRRAIASGSGLEIADAAVEVVRAVEGRFSGWPRH
ncbi:hypothetical protein ABZX12_26260 [Kribbella sp. NPDC003505]|uniref:hypothetical protein n=1 Tax=Kribbella sp. NPDC003505 TaxID=3154448 RepID=UPI00339F732D